MTQSQTYKALLARPSHVLDPSGEMLDGATVMPEPASETRDTSSYAIHTVRNEMRL